MIVEMYVHYQKQKHTFWFWYFKECFEFCCAVKKLCIKETHLFYRRVSCVLMLLNASRPLQAAVGPANAF